VADEEGFMIGGQQFIKIGVGSRNAVLMIRV